MRKRAIVALLLLGLALLALTGCSASRTRGAPIRHVSPADSLYEDARRAGVPGMASYDPARALASYEEFALRYPSDRRTTDVLERAALLREVVELREELRRLKEIDLRRRFTAFSAPYSKPHPRP